MMCVPIVNNVISITPRYRGYMIGSILYEDFMINPRRSLAELLAMLDVRREALGPAAEALKVGVRE